MQTFGAIRQPVLRRDGAEDDPIIQDAPASPQAPFPAFQYHTSFHHLDSSQSHPTAVTHHSPLSAELKVDTVTQGAQLGQVPVPATESTATKAHHRQTSSADLSYLPFRTPGAKPTLSIGYYTGDSLSPASAVSSPLLGSLADITPLPSPLTTVGSPSPWMRMVNLLETSPPNSDHGSSLKVVNAEPDTVGFSSPKKRKAYQGLLSADPSTSSTNPHIHAVNESSHARNRSLSEYVPGSVQIPRARNVATSGTQTPTGADPPSSSPMHREEYLAIQRGISALPAPRPPTPPGSNRSTTGSSDLEASPLGRTILEGPLPLRYQAQTVHGGVIKRWTAIKQLGKGTFSTVMLATSEEIDTGHPEDCVIYTEHGSNSKHRVNPKSLVAVKVCEHGPAGGADEKKIESSLKRELDILKSIHHPSLVHLKAVNVLDKRAFLVLNYCAGGDLFDLASLKLDLLVPSLVRRIFSELVAAVKYLHSQFIVHRDIKLESTIIIIALVNWIDFMTLINISL